MFFADAARVHTPDAFFLEHSGLRLDANDGAFYSVGAGAGFRTPVGALRIMLGIKLNPSPLDLRDPKTILEELLSEDGDVTSIAANPWRRFRFHLSLGQPF